MKATGIVRPVDALGRVVIPVELRRNLNIKTEDSLEIFVDGQYIMLKKYEPSCIFCGEVSDSKIDSRQNGMRKLHRRNEETVKDKLKNIKKACLEWAFFSSLVEKKGNR